jgi:hypothetical protein
MIDNTMTEPSSNPCQLADDLPPPEPHLKLMWRDGQYRVSRANVDWMDCYTADQMRAYGDARAAAATERAAQICDEHASIEGIAQRCAAAIRAGS